MPGYCRKREGGWSYSPAAVDLLRSFMEQFPVIFNHLHENPKADKYYESELLSAGTEELVCGPVHITLQSYIQWERYEHIL